MLAAWENWEFVEFFFFNPSEKLIRKSIVINQGV